jgi:hypothetical protein
VLGYGDQQRRIVAQSRSPVSSYPAAIAIVRAVTMAL